MFHSEGVRAKRRSDGENPWDRRMAGAMTEPERDMIEAFAGDSSDWQSGRWRVRRAPLASVGLETMRGPRVEMGRAQWPRRCHKGRGGGAEKVDGKGGVELIASLHAQKVP
jgi:hypothetical protein